MKCPKKTNWLGRILRAMRFHQWHTNEVIWPRRCWTEECSVDVISTHTCKYVMVNVNRWRQIQAHRGSPKLKPSRRANCLLFGIHRTASGKPSPNVPAKDWTIDDELNSDTIENVDLSIGNPDWDLWDEWLVISEHSNVMSACLLWTTFPFIFVQFRQLGATQ